MTHKDKAPVSEPIRLSVLQEAGNLIAGDREDQYGDPLDHFTEVAAVWSVLLDVTIKPAQVALLMAALKLVRLAEDPLHRDSAVDLSGYAALAHEVARRSAER